MKIIQSSDAPAPGGHYSHAIQANGFTFVSGMLPGPGVATSGPDNFERQVRATLEHCESVLEAAGCAFEDVVQCTAYIVGIERWPEFNRIYAAYFGEHQPARAVVPVPELHHGFLVELQMVACSLS
ncbi:MULTISPECIES: RidA family protein [unclassified Burkholderia]|uniref:RidA family protein n=1 Tax=unclassified Burkholderia TaxID=2613784 RepID=UPI002AB011E2|nr:MULTISPECIES: RidA family protein [unclassified Burkholderia]